jgi:signal peptidase I
MNFLKKLYRFSNSWTGTIFIVLFLIFFVAQSFVIPSGSMKRTLLVGDFLFAKKFSYGIPTPTLPWINLALVPDFNNNGHLINGEKPQRGDIVIFKNPKDTDIHFVKRCIATGGDEIIYQDKKLLIHFNESNEWVAKNFPKAKSFKIDGKLWVENPYMTKFKGIQYKHESDYGDIFRVLMGNASINSADVDMTPVYIPSLGGEIYDVKGERANAMYKKVEDDKFYMMGDNRDNSNDSRFWGSVEYRHIIGKPWVIYFSWDTDTMSVRWDRLGASIDELQYLEPHDYN